MRRDVKLYMLATAVAGFSILEGIYPVLLNLYLLRLGYGAAFVGVVGATGMLGYALFSFPAGIVSRSIGIRRGLLWGLGIATLSHILLPAGEFLPLSVRAPWILACYLVATLGLSLYFVSAGPFLVGASRPENRNMAFSARMTTSILAGFVGSLAAGAAPGWTAALLGLSTSDPAAYRYPLMAAGVLCLVAVAMLTTTSEVQASETAHDAQASRTSSRAIAVLVVVMSGIAMLRTAGLAASRMFFNVYLDDGLGIPTAQIGMIFAGVQLAALPVAMAMPALAARLGSFRVIVGGSLGIAASMLPLALVPHWLAGSIGRFGTYACSAIADSALGVYQLEIVPARWRAIISGAATTALGLSWALVSYLGGRVIATAGFRPLFLATGLLTTLGTFLFWLYFRRPRGEFAAQHAQPGE